MDLAQNIPAPAKKSAAKRVNAAFGEASAHLKEQGRLTPLTVSFLFCLTVTGLWVVVLELMGVFMNRVAVPNFSVDLLAFADVMYYILAALLFMLGVMPLWLGRLRMAGRMQNGEMPLLKEVFYYFGNARRFGRAFLTGLILVAEVFIPIMLFALAVLGWALTGLAVGYDDLSPFSSTPSALTLLLGIPLLLAIAVGLFFLTGFYRLSTAIAVGNEDVPVWRSVPLACKAAKGNMKALFLYALRSIGQLLLSFCTVGVLYLFWYAHLQTVTYLRLSMALCPKGE